MTVDRQDALNEFSQAMKAGIIGVSGAEKADLKYTCYQHHRGIKLVVDPWTWVQAKNR